MCCPSRSCASWVSRRSPRTCAIAASCPRAACSRSMTSSRTPALAEALRIAPGDRVVRFTRLRLGSDVPMAVETTWIASALVPGLRPSHLDGSLYELLARRYRLAPGSASVTIEPVLPDLSTRRHLGIPARQACLAPAHDRLGRSRAGDDDRGLRLSGRSLPARGERARRHGSGPPGAAPRLMHILAVDGGQSAIRLRHSSSDRVVEVHGVSRLEGDTVDAVASAIAQGWLGSGFGPCDRVVLGLSTAPADEPSQVQLCRHRQPGHRRGRGVARGRLGHMPRRSALAGLGREHHGRHGCGVPGGARGG